MTTLSPILSEDNHIILDENSIQIYYDVTNIVPPNNILSEDNHIILDENSIEIYYDVANIVPPDILLPINAKKFAFIDNKYPYNSHWDLNWSFTFALTGTEHAFSTFLTKNSTTISQLGGQYLGYLNTPPILNNLLVIAFDSTGKFALSSGGNPGISIDNIKPNSLIIRNYINEVIFNESLSSLSTQFILSSSIPIFQTLRFRLANASNKLSIDVKTENCEYYTLTSISLNSPSESKYNIYPGFSFCSPISSLNTPSKLWLKNFHSQGNISQPSYDIVSHIPLTISNYNSYTSISGISAYPKPS